MSRRRTLLIAALAGGAVALGAWTLSGSLPQRAPAGASLPTYQQIKTASLDRARATPTVPCSIAAREQVIQALEAGIEDPQRVLNADMRQGLARRLADYLVARSETTSAAYLALAGASSTVWIAPEDDARWTHIIRKYSFVTDGKSPRRNDPQEALTTILEHCLNKEGARIGSIGTGPSGARILVGMARSIEAFGRTSLKDPEDDRYWLTNTTTPALFFRVPPESPEDLLARHQQLVIAETLNLVRIRNDSPSIVWGFWFWNPDRREWHCAQLFSKGYYLNDLQF